MDKKTIIKKKRILSRISRKQYRELLSFVERFYLADYSLKILIARKGSNLFSALIDLVREEDGGRVRRLYEANFKDKPEPVIISDRAVDYFAKAIKAGNYPSILIADDTIRHGKTVFGLCDRVSKLLSEYSGDSSLEVCTFAACKEEMLDSDFVKKEGIKHFVDLGEYRIVSDMVIDILSLAGQPYTSYVPNVELQKELEPSLYQAFADKTRELLKQEVDEVDVLNQKRLDLYHTKYIDSKTLDFAMFQSIRFYLYEDMELCTLVPMVSLLPISKTTLWKYGEILKSVVLADYYEKVFPAYSELSYRVIIYVVSALYLRQYIREELHYKGTLPVLENVEEEKLNFGEQVLNQQKLELMCAQDISKILEALKTNYKRIDPDEIRSLDTDIEDMHNELTQKMSDTLPQHTDSYVKRFFSISGDRSERHQCAYPFVCLSNLLSGQGNDGEFYSKILGAIDYGSGSIVAWEKKKGDETYYLPFLVAGERNYKYKEEKYFPILYGLLEIERKSAEKGLNPIAYKEKFLEQIPRPEGYDEMRDKEEWEELCDADITTQYKPVLLKDVWRYPEKEKLNVAMRLADKIMQ